MLILMRNCFGIVYLINKIILISIDQTLIYLRLFGDRFLFTLDFLGIDFDLPQTFWGQTLYSTSKKTLLCDFTENLMDENVEIKEEIFSDDDEEINKIAFEADP